MRREIPRRGVVAIHEAGHAVVAMTFFRPCRINFVHITGDTGECRAQFVDGWPSTILYAAGGPFWEARHTESGCYGSRSDERIIVRAAEVQGLDPVAAAHDANEILLDLANEGAVMWCHAQIANQLLARDRLDASMLRQIRAEYNPGLELTRQKYVDRVAAIGRRH